MGKALVIVESPTKTKKIREYLGKDYTVTSSVGHIRDLPVSGDKQKADPKARAQAAAITRKLPPEERDAHRQQRSKENQIARMGVDPENGWKACYEILPKKEKVVAELKQLAAQASEIYLATDPDREGEAIAWHLQETIGGDPSKYRRVTFNEITKQAVKEAFAKPEVVNMRKVQSQLARRFLDRVVGYMLSPLLWEKIARGLSAGRVQSVAVRLIVEREKEIHSFVPEEFWELYADLLTPKKDAVRFQLHKYRGEKFRPSARAETMEALKGLEKLPFIISRRDDKPTTTKALAPFKTSTLQQAGSTRLGFSIKKTMMIAQRLYEAGHITYMRTDSTNISDEALAGCRDFILKQYGDAYLPAAPIVYSNKKGAQEAHEAVRPTDIAVSEVSLPQVGEDANRLYQLIWSRFVACQMNAARYTSTTVYIEPGDFDLRAKGRIMEFDGFTRVYKSGKESEEILPSMQEKDPMSVEKLDPVQHFTKPPPRFREGTLVKELENRGIGRPSTYSSIITTIQSRGYVKLEEKRFYAQKIGEVVTERLEENFDDLMDYAFTAQMEESLDEIANGEKDWITVLDRFYAGFKIKLGLAAEDGMRPNNPIDIDLPCPVCAKNMQIRIAGTGVFLGCSGYQLPPKERCKQTINLVSGDHIITLEDEEADEDAVSRDLIQRKRCPICDTTTDSYLIDESRKIHICGNSPDCTGYIIEKGTFKLKGYSGPLIECDKCGQDMQLRMGRFGKYFACTSEECKNTRKLLRNGEAAPPKMDPVRLPELACEKVDDFYLLRDGASGLFLAASQFPKNRETRAPLVAEILPHAEELDPKYAYLLTAPVEDPDGNKAIIRFSRKTSEQYVLSEENAKPTGWKAFYRDGKWLQETKESTKPAAAKKTTPKKATAKKATAKKPSAKKGTADK